MYRSYLRYFIGFFVAIGLIIILIVLLFGGDGKKTTTTSNEQPPKQLTDLSKTDGEVRMTIAGQIRATQLYREIVITSSRDKNTIQIINGYQGDVADSRSFDNNEQGFYAFLRALNFAGYMNGDKSEELANDVGHCSLGQRYIFEIIENGETTQRYWSTSCGKNSPKTYLGSTSTTMTLFEKQIPGYDDITDDVDF